jgi:hypothetical protein
VFLKQVKVVAKGVGKPNKVREAINLATNMEIIKWIEE